MKHFFTLFFLILIFSACSKKQNINRPFPQNNHYNVSYIFPNNFTTGEKNNQVRDFYDKWKTKYLKSCKNGSYFIDYNDKGWNVSEGTGYGMMITAYMAGYDPNAKKYFDGLYLFYRNHPSSIDSSLMAWQQKSDCQNNTDNGVDAASDGDIDIAYALLLADKQWGSDGQINYIEAAKKIIAAILKDEINHQTNTVKLGDWVSSDDTKYFFGTRSSDFICDHFRAFARATGNGYWSEIIDKCYSIDKSIQNNFSPKTGLIPDFIISTNDKTYPACPNYLEDKNDGNYYYNACRDPWRICTDFLVSNDYRAKNILKKINLWIIDTTKGDVSKIAPGYTLDGSPLDSDYQDVCFFGAFAVSAMVSDNQNWLNSLYSKLINNSIDSSDYFGNTLKLLYLIVLTENWWEP
jgi:hypothetical protein